MKLETEMINVTASNNDVIPETTIPTVLFHRQVMCSCVLLSSDVTGFKITRQREACKKSIKITISQLVMSNQTRSVIILPYIIKAHYVAHTVLSLISIAISLGRNRFTRPLA